MTYNPLSLNLVHRVGSALQHTLRACTGWPALLTAVKLPCLLGGLLILKSTPLRRYSPMLRTEQGLLLAGHPTDSMLNAVVFYRELFEPGLSEVIEQLVQPGELCVDAGANVGYFSLLLAHRVGPRGKVLAIEAAPGNLQRLERNIALNGFADRVRVVGAAYTNETGPVTFYISRRNDMNCRLDAPNAHGIDRWLMGGPSAWRTTSVPTTTLGAALGERAADVSFIKLDIEGAEHLVVSDILTHCIHPALKVALEAKQPHIRATLQAFEAAGFQLYDLHNSYRWLYNRDRQRRPTPISYEDAYRKRYMVDVLLSRQALEARFLDS